MGMDWLHPDIVPANQFAHNDDWQCIAKYSLNIWHLSLKCRVAWYLLHIDILNQHLRESYQ